jgi:hypothetical protein
MLEEVLTVILTDSYRRNYEPNNVILFNLVTHEKTTLCSR